jgi:predicted phage tail protein
MEARRNTAQDAVDALEPDMENLRQEFADAE